MTKPKKPNPIEEAIGERAKTPETPSRVLRDAPEQPMTQNEMASLESLNQATMERLQDRYPENEELEKIPQSPEQIKEQLRLRTKLQETETRTIPITPVSKRDHLPVTKTSSQESPPQKTEYSTDSNLAEKLPTEFENTKTDFSNETSNPGDFKIKIPAEEKELTALRDLIMSKSFVVSGIQYHIVALCSQPMAVPSTTSWNFKDRALIPSMVLALLKQDGYIDGIWPSLKIVMGTSIGNATWTAGISTSIAFYDVVRTLPMFKEIQNEENEKKS